jgi:hypothetical protein
VARGCVRSVLCCLNRLEVGGRGSHGEGGGNLGRNYSNHCKSVPATESSSTATMTKFDHSEKMSYERTLLGRWDAHVILRSIWIWVV